MRTTRIVRSVLVIVALNLLANAVLAQSVAASQLVIGNGDKNWIVTEGVRRVDGTLTFSEVQIDGNGWLVIALRERSAEWR